ncbi:hypothetical protein EJ08DRAFT_650086 [Tothia fuscella]|uniref:CWH43-like N-terminal domain-containing protein n=1 Tax=Tothia fuscella TaxID=1048955 RepID=A0A9P4TYG2_9PEZI|nr:hypothetical protein EJ08DRAFT_650086 [Tothia fuscella]
MWGLSYWVFPLFSALVWLAMLLAMFLTWIIDGKPHYPSMEPDQRIAYISDVGADKLKPLFIAMSTITVVVFDISFIFERWLRHTGRLAHNTSTFQKVLSWLTIVFAVVGGAGLILLSIFDTRRHPNLHDVFLVLFIGGYIISAVFICWEYQRLGVRYREYKVLAASFWVKLTFIFVEVAMAVAFGVTSKYKYWNTAAILEWIIALIYTFYVLSFFMDFIPAIRRHGMNKQSHETEEQMATRESDNGFDVNTLGRNNYTHQDDYTPGRHYGNGNTNGYVPTNGTNGYQKPSHAY